jgi:glutamate synthase domain-containing protein 1
MEAAMIHRGPDSTGFALYGEQRSDEGVVVRARFAEASRRDETLRDVVDGAKHLGCGLVGEPSFDDAPGRGDRFCRLVFDLGDVKPAALLSAVESVPGVYVHSMGHRLEIVKDVGNAYDVAERHGIDDFVGTHGLAHSRLATESMVDVEFSHPFWARPYLDIAIVHNGQLTNYYKMRRLMELQGFEFLTFNDSELISVYIARQLSSGNTLHSALERSVTELDGVFTYMLSTPDGMGAALDRLAIKPLVVTETDNKVAAATEEQALRRIFPDEIQTYHPHEGRAIVWSAATEEVEAA